MIVRQLLGVARQQSSQFRTYDNNDEPLNLSMRSSSAFAVLDDGKDFAKVFMLRDSIV